MHDRKQGVTKIGCDIHILTEIRYPKEKWKLWLQRPYVAYPDDAKRFPHSNDEIDCISARSYTFFGILAGVRDHSARYPIAEHRGIPQNASDEVNLWADTCQYHSLTWCTLSEMERAIKRYNRETLRDSLENYVLSSRFFEEMNVAPMSTTVYLPRDERSYKDGFYFPTITAQPVRDQYEMIKGEREFLGLGKPRIRFIIGFDS